MECIFNELSANPVETVTEAGKVMAHFVGSVVAAQQFGLERVRLTEEIGNDLYNLPLASDYTVGSWLSDERVDPVLRDRFRQIAANPPLLKDDEIEALSVFERSIFCLIEPAGTPEAKGFGAAYLGNWLLLSLLTHDQWNTRQISGWHWFLDNDGQEKTENVIVSHFATVADVELHKPWIQRQQNELLQRSIDVWEKRTEFFSDIILCGDVQKQLRKVGMSSYLTQIIARLRTLNGFAASWTSGDFDLTALKTKTNLDVSVESPSTMNLHSASRRFKLPDGRRELFEMHIKTGNFRFHFYADNQNRKVYVGYIGPHLPTATG
ncbi:hypothetical protein [Spirosoma linguale]|uniref:Uncharacterized protein n=1 Tax=Spirosoma linguale (strain ATCC 33905 / DSM 74 / LMG 10896 / Claus 1) TaxID=504472 RepID=D2QPA7_SPILD|nr:hypothetical protein Slin_3407 [Spirosoma linguale DSM 74]